jgi:hypothetical protein
MCWSVDAVLFATADGITGVPKKKPKISWILGSGSKKTSGRSQLSCSQYMLTAVSSFPRHQRLSQDPHLIQRHRHHD